MIEEKLDHLLLNWWAEGEEDEEWWKKEKDWETYNKKRLQKKFREAIEDLHDEDDEEYLKEDTNKRGKLFFCGKSQIELM